MNTFSLFYLSLCFCALNICILFLFIRNCSLFIHHYFDRVKERENRLTIFIVAKQLKCNIVHCVCVLLLLLKLFNAKNKGDCNIQSVDCEIFQSNLICVILLWIVFCQPFNKFLNSLKLQQFLWKKRIKILLLNYKYIILHSWNISSYFCRLFEEENTTYFLLMKLIAFLMIKFDIICKKY